MIYLLYDIIYHDRDPHRGPSPRTLTADPHHESLYNLYRDRKPPYINNPLIPKRLCPCIPSPTGLVLDCDATDIIMSECVLVF